MLSIGLVDIDTSHPRSFAKRLNAHDGVKVVGVFDGGTVRSDEEVAEFCRDFECSRFATLEEMADAVNAAAILSVDWDLHVSRAEPFLKRGKPVYIDKPLAGSVADLNKFAALAEETGTAVLGGSGWRFNRPVAEAAKRFADAEISDVFALIDHKYYFYGIHLVEMTLGLLGPGIESVELLAMNDDAHVLYFSHKNGAKGHLFMQAGCCERTIWFNADGRRQSVSFDLEDIHNSVCNTFLDIIRGKKPPVSPLDLTESCRVMLAGLISFEQSAPIKIADLPDDARYGSTEFLKIYKNIHNK